MLGVTVDHRYSFWSFVPCRRASERFINRRKNGPYLADFEFRYTGVSILKFPEQRSAHVKRLA